MSDDNITDDKVVKLANYTKVLNNNEDELSNEGFDDLVCQLYVQSRSIFDEYIVDPDIRKEAVKHLRLAFLYALNPLEDIDNEFDNP